MLRARCRWNSWFAVWLPVVLLGSGCGAAALGEPCGAGQECGEGICFAFVCRTACNHDDDCQAGRCSDGVCVDGAPMAASGADGGVGATGDEGTGDDDDAGASPISDDAGTIDAGANDAGTIDAGTDDAGAQVRAREARCALVALTVDLVRERDGAGRVLPGRQAHRGAAARDEDAVRVGAEVRADRGRGDAQQETEADQR
ncbi:MAG: hypothetical protein ACO3JL_17595, partial [Myxococcota bacterium]